MFWPVFQFFHQDTCHYHSRKSPTRSSWFHRFSLIPEVLAISGKDDGSFSEIKELKKLRIWKRKESAIQTFSLVFLRLQPWTGLNIFDPGHLGTYFTRKMTPSYCTNNASLQDTLRSRLSSNLHFPLSGLFVVNIWNTHNTFNTRSKLPGTWHKTSR